MGWAAHVSVDEMQRRASARKAHNKRRQQAAQARRVQVRVLMQRWGTSAAAKVKMATLLRVSVSTIGRDLQALAEAPPLPLICPTCGLPSRLDVDPSDLTDDPVVLARLEAALARLVGADADPEAIPRRRVRAPSPRAERRQGDNWADPRVRTLAATGG